MKRQIEVDTDVFAAIWTNRMDEESSENQILRRLLLGERVLPDLVSGRHNYLSAATKVENMIEVKTSKFDAIRQSQGKVSEMGKIRWVDDIRAALVELGGLASLHSIYRNVEQRRREGDRSLPRTLEAIIRRTLEDHSSDSANFKAADLFALVGRGEWALRSMLRE